MLVVVFSMQRVVQSVFIKCLETTASSGSFLAGNNSLSLYRSQINVNLGAVFQPSTWWSRCKNSRLCFHICQHTEIERLLLLSQLTSGNQFSGGGSTVSWVHYEYSLQLCCVSIHMEKIFSLWSISVSFGVREINVWEKKDRLQLRESHEVGCDNALVRKACSQRCFP